MTSRVRLPDKVLRELQASGLPWHLEGGAKHHHLILNGKLVAVMGRTPSRRRGRDAAGNVVAAIRRAVRDRQQQ